MEIACDERFAKVIPSLIDNLDHAITKRMNVLGHAETA